MSSKVFAYTPFMRPRIEKSVDVMKIENNVKRILSITRVVKNKLTAGGIKDRLTDFIERFSHNLNFNEENIQKIILISKLCSEHNLIYDNTPPAMAAGCIYLYIKLNNLQINKKEVSDKCFISEVTINKCYKKLHSNQSFLKDLQNKYDFTK